MLREKTKIQWNVQIVDIDNCMDHVGYQQNRNGTIQYRNPFVYDKITNNTTHCNRSNISATKLIITIIIMIIIFKRKTH